MRPFYLSPDITELPTADITNSQIRQTNELLILAAAEKDFARAGFGGATKAAIAEGSGLPKANLHYYFGSKKDLYRAVLAHILSDWLEPIACISKDAEPRAAIEQYIRAKMALARLRPDGLKVFVNELLHGALVGRVLSETDLHDLMASKAAVIYSWVDAGRMAKVNGTHLFFTIWAATQTYADFDVQVSAVLGRSKLTAKNHAETNDHVVSLIFRGCGL